jgi:hypothetical protein
VVKVQVRFTQTQAIALKRLAARQNVSVAELIRQAIDDWLRKPGRIDLDERKRRALAVSGRFHSGQPNLSTAHDQYLEEAFDA